MVQISFALMYRLIATSGDSFLARRAVIDLRMQIIAVRTIGSASGAFDGLLEGFFAFLARIYALGDSLAVSSIHFSSLRYIRLHR